MILFTCNFNSPNGIQISRCLTFSSTSSKISYFFFSTGRLLCFKIYFSDTEYVEELPEDYKEVAPGTERTNVLEENNIE